MRAWYFWSSRWDVGENGAVNGNGQQMALADTYENPSATSFAKPKIWSITGNGSSLLAGIYALGRGELCQVRWVNTNATSVVSNSNSWLAGVVAHWDPVKNLDFEFELLYQDTWTAVPNGFHCRPAHQRDMAAARERLRDPLRSHPQLVII